MSNSNKFKNRWFQRKPPQENPKLIEKAHSCDNLAKFGYTGYHLYFPEDSNLDDEEVCERVSNFEVFIENNQTNFPFQTIETEKFFTVDYKMIVNDAVLTGKWPNLCTDLINTTDYCLNCFGLAMHQFLIKHFNINDSQKKDLAIVRARLINYQPILQLKDLKVNYYGKLVSVRGTVIRAGSSKLLCQYMVFVCSICRGTQLIKQPDGIFTVPVKCPTHGCRAQSRFDPLYSSVNTRTVGWQTIKIQELIGVESENGRVPRSIDCELTEDLINSCVPGDDVTITAILKVRNNTETTSKQQNSVFLLYLDVISIINNKNQSHGSYGACERITFNLRDYYAIQKIHAEPQLFRFLTQSLCPNIYGHEIVKAGLLLGLFGGTKSERVRSESHILIVGDPGLGKSQMLQACSNIAPRGVYVCGNTSTGSGLTVTMTRESGSEFGLEAGALMLADQGCCCIDEFDKMPNQHACLLEAMEQQSISIAKAGTVCTLPTRTTILAAANPAGGHYNKAKTVAENLKMSSPMLSRFDLIFILLDQPNEETDMLLSEHVLALHSGRKFDCTSMNTTKKAQTNDLKERLKLQTGEIIDHLPHSLFRKYIAYAQKYVNPQLSDGAKTIIKDFYMRLRRQFQTGDCTPITTRQLNSLIRLTQARAKIELREIANETDANDIVEIMKASLNDIFTDNYGIMDATRSQNSTGMSSKNQIMKLLKALQRRSEINAKSLFTTNEIREICESVGICKIKFYTVLQTLNIQGFLLNKGGNKYQLVIAD